MRGSPHLNVIKSGHFLLLLCLVCICRKNLEGKAKLLPPPQLVVSVLCFRGGGDDEDGNSIKGVFLSLYH